MSEPSREEIASILSQFFGGKQHLRNQAADAILALRAAKPERERVMSKDELETEMRDLAMTVKIATIEACATICNRWIASKNLHERLAATDIAQAIRALKGTLS